MSLERSFTTSILTRVSRCDSIHRLVEVSAGYVLIRVLEYGVDAMLGSYECGPVHVEGGLEGFYKLSLVMLDVYWREASSVEDETNVQEVFVGMPRRDKDSVVRPLLVRVLITNKIGMVWLTIKGSCFGFLPNVDARDANGSVRANYEDIFSVVMKTLLCQNGRLILDGGLLKCNVFAAAIVHGWDVFAIPIMTGVRDEILKSGLHIPFSKMKSLQAFEDIKSSLVPFIVFGPITLVFVKFLVGKWLLLDVVRDVHLAFVDLIFRHMAKERKFFLSSVCFSIDMLLSLYTEQRVEGFFTKYLIGLLHVWNSLGCLPPSLWFEGAKDVGSDDGGSSCGMVDTGPGLFVVFDDSLSQ